MTLPDLPRTLTRRSDGAAIRMEDVAQYDAVCLVGPAGIGKSFELRRLARHDCAGGRHVAEETLAGLAVGGRLVERLRAFTAEQSAAAAMHIDALDEVFSLGGDAVRSVCAWIDELKPLRPRPRVRFACRSAIWPPPIVEALQRTFGDSVIEVLIEPLDLEAIRRAAESAGVAPDNFVGGLERGRLTTLARSPLTLGLLLGMFYRDGRCTTAPQDVWDRGLRRLASERNERLDFNRNAQEFPPDVIIGSAERLACFMLMCGAESVHMGDERVDGALNADDLAGLACGEPPLDRQLLVAIGASGLCRDDGPRRFRFMHRNIAECLAGRRIARMPVHLARNLVRSSLGWTYGVAGPLRETAAFAAAGNRDIADWIAEYDPELVGLSDIANDDLRRRALLGLVLRAKQQEAIDLDIRGLLAEGFRYPGVEDDLRPLLRGCSEHGHEIGLLAEIAEALDLSSLATEFADLALDARVPMEARVRAGYTVVKIGDRYVQHRLKPLAIGAPIDPHWRLKGLALRGSWPDNLTTTELFDAVEARPARAYFGAYEGFLLELDRAGFAADGDRVRGLAWCKRLTNWGKCLDACGSIVSRIARAAMRDLPDRDVAAALADLLLAAARSHAESPLGGTARKRVRSDESDIDQTPTIDWPGVDARRELVDAIAAAAAEPDSMWSLAHHMPGLVLEEDLEWLLGRAVEETRTPTSRRAYAELARVMFNASRCDHVEAWFGRRAVSPVSEVFPFPTETVIGSEQARRAKEAYDRSRVRPKEPVRTRVIPSPKRRVAKALAECEERDHRAFHALCHELTLEPASTHYGFERFLTLTPGWAAADTQTRGRIVNAAKKFLESEHEEPELVKTIPLNRILVGVMAAVWLVLEHDAAWLEGRPSDWWRRWAWYFVRELHLNLGDEPNDPKRAVLAMVCTKAPEEVLRDIVHLAGRGVDDGSSLLTSVLDALPPGALAGLEVRLANELRNDRVAPASVYALASFLLRRESKEGIDACLHVLGAGTSAWASVTSATLHWGAISACQTALDSIEAHPHDAAAVLADYCHGQDFRLGRDQEVPASWSDSAFCGRLAKLLLERFPPETDPKHDGAYMVGPEDSARRTRDRLIAHLAEQPRADAVDALRELERVFGERYPWLKRRRLRAERALRLRRPYGLDLATVAEVLRCSDPWLIRDAPDAVDAIMAALESLQREMEIGRPSPAEGLWNTPRVGAPTPKAEKVVAEHIAGHLRRVLERYAVGIVREPEVVRRQVSGPSGRPATEPDIVLLFSTRTTANGRPIEIPLEIKLSENIEARSGLDEQLARRYLHETGAGHGVFVVAWMDAPGMSSKHAPRWESLEVAEQDLARQAKAASAKYNVDVCATVLDCRLR